MHINSELVYSVFFNCGRKASRRFRLLPHQDMTPRHVTTIEPVPAQPPEASAAQPDAGSAVQPRGSAAHSHWVGALLPGGSAVHSYWIQAHPPEGSAAHPPEGSAAHPPEGSAAQSPEAAAWRARTVAGSANSVPARLAIRVLACTWVPACECHRAGRRHWFGSGRQSCWARLQGSIRRSPWDFPWGMPSVGPWRRRVRRGGEVSSSPPPSAARR